MQRFLDDNGLFNEIAYWLSENHGVMDCRVVDRAWLTAYDEGKKQIVLFSWNGEALWGPFVCNDTRDLGFSDQGSQHDTLSLTEHDDNHTA